MIGNALFANMLKLSTQRLLLLLLSVMFISSGCQARQKVHAEQRLDQMLGQEQQNGDIFPDIQTPQTFPDPLASAPQDQTPEQGQNSDPFGGFPDWAKKMVPGQADIQVKEETSQYRVVVNLSNPKDANSVKVTALPHRVEVSGQSSFGKDGMEGSSSFFKSFTTSSELVPSQMKREEHDKTLEFLIPKKVASQPIREQNDTKPAPIKRTQTPAPELSPDVLEQLNSTENRAI